MTGAALPTVGYIGGLGRSGSTLLETIAARFDEVCVLGEVVHLWERAVRDDRLCSCGEPFSRCPFWLQVGELAFGGWRCAHADDVYRLRLQVDRTRKIPAAVCSRDESTHARAMREYSDRFAAVYAAAAQVSGASVVIDSSKHVSTAFVLRRRTALDLRIVHMVRDSRGVAYSWAKEVTAEPEQIADDNPLYMQRYPPWLAAVHWNSQNAAFGALARTTTPVWLLRYEDLLAAPVETTRQLAVFLGLPVDKITEFLTSTQVLVGGRTHQIAGNPMRFNTGPVALRRDDAWRDELPAADRRLVTALTAPLMGRYGYLGAPRR